MASTAQKIREVADVAVDQGWRIDRMTNGHLKWTPPDPEAEMVITSGMTSNWNYRSFENALSHLRRNGLTYPAVGATQRLDRAIDKLDQESPMQESIVRHAAPPRFEIAKLPELGPPPPDPDRPAEVTVEFKKCTKCGVTKPWSRFALKRSQPTGLQSWCKECHAENDRRGHAAYAAAPEPEAEPDAPEAAEVPTPEAPAPEAPAAPAEAPDGQPSGPTLAQLSSALDAAISMIEELADSFVEHKRATEETVASLRASLVEIGEVMVKTSQSIEGVDATLTGISDRLDLVEAKAANIDPIASFRARLGR